MLSQCRVVVTGVGGGQVSGAVSCCLSVVVVTGVGGGQVSGAVSCCLSVVSSLSQVLEEDKCQERCRVVGTYLLEQLSALRDEFDVVGDVRGKGLMVGLELVADKVSAGG